MVVRKSYIGTQTRPDGAPNGILHQEDCFATCCAGSDVAHFSPVWPLVSQILAAIRVCKCRERLDSPMVVRKHYIASESHSRHLGVFGAVLKCHLVGRFNAGGSSLNVDRYFFVAEWRFFAD